MVSIKQHFNLNQKLLSWRHTKYPNQQLTSEFLGWVVEVACVWLNHTAIIYKSGETNSQYKSVEHQNYLPKCMFITVSVTHFLHSDLTLTAHLQQQNSQFVFPSTFWHPGMFEWDQAFIKSGIEACIILIGQIKLLCGWQDAQPHWWEFLHIPVATEKTLT